MVAACVLSAAGALQVTVRLLPEPCASAAAATVLGVAVAVVRVAVADHALDPALFALCTCTSNAAPAIRPDRLYGLVTPDTVVHVPAPDGLDRRL